MDIKRLIPCLASGVVAGACSLSGATLGLEDGSRIEGELIKIHDGTVYFETAFAGVLEIPQEQVISLTSEEVLNLRTTGGEVFRGPVSGEADGQVAIDSQAGPVEADLGQLTSAWRPGSEDPVVVAREAALESQLRKWSYTAGVDISGSDGNTDEFGSSITAQAKLEGPQDRLLIYGSYAYEEANGVRSKDEQKGGVNYTSFFSEKMGWYLRQELERDTFEGVDFRSTTGAGLSYRFIKEDRLSLEGNAGVSYRYEDYIDDALDSDGFPGLDFGLDLDWQFADWGKLVSSLNYIPSVDDFGDYLIEHESGIDIPLGTSDAWVMRFGLSNDYNSNPGGGREKLDTSYFARLILNWD
jgi:putative salt-induced outer membrane protein YdiY